MHANMTYWEFWSMVLKWAALLVIPYALITVVVQGILLRTKQKGIGRWIQDIDETGVAFHFLGILWPCIPVFLITCGIYYLLGKLLGQLGRPFGAIRNFIATAKWTPRHKNSEEGTGKLPKARVVKGD